MVYANFRLKKEHCVENIGTYSKSKGNLTINILKAIVLAEYSSGKNCIVNLRRLTCVVLRIKKTTIAKLFYFLTMCYTTGTKPVFNINFNVHL